MGHRVDLLYPAQRFVFDISRGEAKYVQAADSPTGFAAYKQVQAAGRKAAMIAIPNSSLIQASRPYVVDPGFAMQGAPYSAAVESYGINPWDVKDVILTHLHFDHVQALMEFPSRRTFVHRIELEAPYAQLVQGLLNLVDLEVLDGDEGEIEPGVRWMLTPGHCDGLITLLVDTDEGLVAIASDCVGPLPQYFDQMTLPEDFPERDVLLAQWQRIRDLRPVRVIPGHYAPFNLDANG